MKRWPERLGRSRTGAWLWPVLLFVLLAAGGMPERAILLASPQGTVLDEDGACRSPAHHAAVVQQHRVDAVLRAVSGLPRVVLRTRSVTEAGLPMPRAPCA